MRPRGRVFFIQWTFLLLGCVACRSSDVPEALNSQQLKGWMQEARESFEQDPERAERLLQRALDADPYYGPAHNNLGLLYYQRGQWPKALEAFEQARKLLPGNPEPRFNLGLTLERVGQYREALEAYRVALEVSPEHGPSIQGCARLCVTQGWDEEALPRWLSWILTQNDSEPWRAWAATEQARIR